MSNSNLSVSQYLSLCPPLCLSVWLTVVLLQSGTKVRQLIRAQVKKRENLPHNCSYLAKFISKLGATCFVL
jgi:hypothetical protein